ncbi:protein of unknown function [Methylorubrum extorquens]|uniref:Uncharacterized protein n=1 Tax=Methylorubrum extorquens TaxID=408 RepID=A0A2N9AUD7_METEX|nr:protein of unknown function [Methylorubrum extorquens]
MQHRNYIPYSESTGPQRPLDRLDDRAEPGIEQIAGHVRVVLDRDRMGEAVARVEDDGDGPFAVAGGEDAGADALFHHALHERAQPYAMAAGDRTGGDGGVEMHGKQVRFAGQHLALCAGQRADEALDLVVGGIGRVGDAGEFRFQIAQPAAGDRIQQGVLRGEVAVDVGMGHARFRRDRHNRDPFRTEPGQVLRGDGEQPRVRRDRRGPGAGGRAGETRRSRGSGTRIGNWIVRLPLALGQGDGDGERSVRQHHFPGTETTSVGALDQASLIESGAVPRARVQAFPSERHFATPLGTGFSANPAWIAVKPRLWGFRLGADGGTGRFAASAKPSMTAR